MRSILTFMCAFFASCATKPVDEKPGFPYMEEAYNDPEHPAEEKPKFFGIVFVGDTGTGDENQYKVAKAMEQYCKVEACDIGLLLGDNIYPKGVKNAADPQFKSKFEEPYKNLKFGFYPVLGNHDNYANEDAEVAYESDKWHMGGRWYSMDGNWVEFFALDSGNFQRPFKGKEQRKWLADMLPRSVAKWKIAYGHYPVFSNGVHGDSIFYKKYLKPLLEANHVDFYISGHDHDKELIESNGVAYVISGAGAKTRPVHKGKNTVWQKSSLGFGHLLLSEKTATIRFISADVQVEFEKTYKK